MEICTCEWFIYFNVNDDAHTTGEGLEMGKDINEVNEENDTTT